MLIEVSICPQGEPSYHQSYYIDDNLISNRKDFVCQLEKEFKYISSKLVDNVADRFFKEEHLLDEATMNDRICNALKWSCHER